MMLTGIGFSSSGRTMREPVTMIAVSVPAIAGLLSGAMAAACEREARAAGPLSLSRRSEVPPRTIRKASPRFCQVRPDPRSSRDSAASTDGAFSTAGAFFPRNKAWSYKICAPDWRDNAFSAFSRLEDGSVMLLSASAGEAVQAIPTARAKAAAPVRSGPWKMDTRCSPWG